MNRWAIHAQEAGVFDLGQLSRDTKKELDKLVKAGQLRKTKALWPWVSHGTCKKTYYYSAGLYGDH